MADVHADPTFVPGLDTKRNPVDPDYLPALADQGYTDVGSAAPAAPTFLSPPAPPDGQPLAAPTTAPTATVGDSIHADTPSIRRYAQSLADVGQGADTTKVLLTGVRVRAGAFGLAKALEKSINAAAGSDAGASSSAADVQYHNLGAIQETIKSSAAAISTAADKLDAAEHSAKEIASADGPTGASSTDGA